MSMSMGRKGYGLCSAPFLMQMWSCAKKRQLKHLPIVMVSGFIANPAPLAIGGWEFWSGKRFAVGA